MMPNFLVVGVPKAGTSSIYHYLNQHPQVYMSPFKEPHFFSFEGECKPDWGITDLESYHSLFNGTENEVAFGEASTWYLYSQTAAERIKHHIPNVKIIMMLRNPIDRAYSSFLFNIQCGWESISDFEEALHLESSRISNNESWDFHYLNAGLYYDQIQRYYNLFPKNQINIFLYEDFKCDSLKVINDIFNFLGVDHSFIPNISQIHNATAFQKNSHINSFFESKNVLKTVLKKCVPSNFRKIISSKIRLKNSIIPPRLDCETRSELINFFEKDIMKTQDFIQKDLSLWMRVD